jgi:hypothetical protein
VSSRIFGPGSSREGLDARAPAWDLLVQIPRDATSARARELSRTVHGRCLVALYQRKRRFAVRPVSTHFEHLLRRPSPGLTTSQPDIDAGSRRGRDESLATARGTLWSPRGARDRPDRAERTPSKAARFRAVA